MVTVSIHSVLMQLNEEHGVGTSRNTDVVSTAAELLEICEFYSIDLQKVLYSNSKEYLITV